MKVWIDMSNSPHPLLFAPVAARLESDGHEVMVTARDNAQTVELTRERWPDAEVIGGPAPPGRVAKARTLARRIAKLRGWARSRRPDVALSHNSYSHIAAARALRLPSVTAMDYEFQPANNIAFRLADAILLPEAVPDAVVRRQGARERKTVRYGGLKEEIYLGDFSPDESVLAALGIAREPGAALVVARTPPTGATYHQFDNPLFLDVLRALDSQAHVRTVVLPRRADQRDELLGLGLSRLTVPERAVETRSLMWYADLVIGAGGTMTREAALLGTPTLSVYAGRVPAVDRWLEERGMLKRLERADQVAGVSPREKGDESLEILRARGAAIIDQFVTTVGRTARDGR
jgi:uncharacterized protein